MNKRLELQFKLEEICGNANVYYQPPESTRMSYPAIVYSRDDIENSFADDAVYKQEHSYSVTVIDKNPDSEIVHRMSLFPRSRFDRHYVANNLNHDVFTIYY